MVKFFFFQSYFETSFWVFSRYLNFLYIQMLLKNIFQLNIVAENNRNRNFQSTAFYPQAVTIACEGVFLSKICYGSSLVSRVSQGVNHHSFTNTFLFAVELSLVMRYSQARFSSTWLGSALTLIFVLNII